ncbi:MAG: glutamate racemase [Firmicutes bacterium]|nr:glutamate racemase [Bacillota bacterium]
MVERPVGVFDSGVGGLTVVSQLFRILPQEDIIYFGDTAHLPYGSKSKEAVTRHSLNIANFLKTQKVKIIVVACNTASSFALSSLREKIDFPVIGVIEPGAQAAIDTTRNFKIGIIGTEGTINSRAFEEALRRIDRNVKVFSQACPLFVPLVEEGWLDKPETSQIAEKYLSPLKDKGIDTLILGCTHYPLLKELLSRIMGQEVSLIDTAEATAKVVERRLGEKNLLRKGNRKAVYKFFVSDDPEKFLQLGRRFLGKSMDKAERVNLEEMG